MAGLQLLLIVFAGVLVINAVVAAILWARHRTPLYRAQFAVWVAGIWSAAIQGVIQSDPAMVFAFGFGGWSVMLGLAELVGRALELERRWRRYLVSFGILFAITVLATLLDAPFWVRALPIAIGSGIPMFDLSWQAWRRPRHTLSIPAHLAVLGVFLLGAHQIDYPFLRPDPRFAPFGFIFGILTVFAISIAVPAIIVEHTNDEVKRLNDELRLRVAEALHAVHAREEFLSIAAHEIRGPLNALQLTVQTLIRKRGDADPDRARLVAIERSGKRLTHFVNQLLDLGAMRSGTFTLAIEAVDLSEVVREVANQVGPEVARSGSSLVLTLQDEVIGQWDRFRLVQVVSNLVTNAVKFGHGNPIDVATSQADGVSMLVVTDHGAGIDPGVRARMFQPFERGVSVQHYGGLGLGLHIVETIVTSMGGAITVQSEVGKGSTFQVTLPTGPVTPS